MAAPFLVSIANIFPSPPKRNDSPFLQAALFVPPDSDIGQVGIEP